MARPVESQLTISCLQCEWSVDATNTSVQASTAFLEAAYAHVDQHEQHALEVVQRLRLYSENYAEPGATQPRHSVCRGQARCRHPDRLPGQDTARALTTDLTPDQRAELDALASMPDAEIDTSDISEDEGVPEPTARRLLRLTQQKQV